MPSAEPRIHSERKGCSSDPVVARLLTNRTVTGEATSRFKVRDPRHSETSEVRRYYYPVSAGRRGREQFTQGRGARITIVLRATDVLRPQTYSKALLRIQPSDRRVKERIRRLPNLIRRIPVKAIVVIEDRRNVEGADLCRFRVIRAQVHGE